MCHNYTLTWDTIISNFLPDQNRSLLFFFPGGIKITKNL